jgi:hypothetical protein
MRWTHIDLGEKVLCVFVEGPKKRVWLTSLGNRVLVQLPWFRQCTLASIGQAPAFISLAHSKGLCTVSSKSRMVCAGALRIARVPAIHTYVTRRKKVPCVQSAGREEKCYASELALASTGPATACIAHSKGLRGVYSKTRMVCAGALRIARVPTIRGA